MRLINMNGSHEVRASPISDESYSYYGTAQLARGAATPTYCTRVVPNDKMRHFQKMTWKI